MLRPFPWGRLVDLYLAQPDPVRAQVQFLLLMAVMVGVMMVAYVPLVGWRGVRSALPRIALVVVGCSVALQVVLFFGP